MTTQTAQTTQLRASDGEREAVAERVRQAAAEGRLTIAEADERQAAAYGATTRADLVVLTDDLPVPPRPRRPEPMRGPMTDRARLWFTVHAGLVALVVAFLVTSWAVGVGPWFFPGWPMFWLALSLVIHYRRARRVEPQS